MPYFGRNIRTAVFGQSHAAAIGVTIDGLPAGEAVDAVELEAFMARRAPEQNRMTTQRREADRPEILCGIVDGRTCGAPLTSIISYVDLLARDDSLSPEARDYVTILNQKTERLKNTIADLFELAKSTSGEAKVTLEPMDLKKLMEQTLEDMSDQIRESGFKVKFQCDAEHTKFKGDVNRMYRVVQNILENALKYSLKGTRIFATISNQGSRVCLTVQNTSGYEMDFTEEEIMERFYRGEKSRTSEGNGLGLSIADSFTANCRGEFKIEIDGDQFKAMILFPILP